MKKIITILMAIVISVVGPVSVFATEIDETELLEENNDGLEVSEISEISEIETPDSENEEDNTDTVSDNETVSENDTHDELPVSTSLRRVSSLNNSLLLTSTPSSENSYILPIATSDAANDGFCGQTQYNSGLCWLYAPLNAMKANIYKKTGKNVFVSGKNPAYYMWQHLTEANDKSEDHALLDGYSELSGDTSEWYTRGGHDSDTYSYFTAWKGLVPNEGVDEDGSYNTNMTLPNESTVYSSDIGHLQGWVETTGRACGTNGIKDLIRTYGAVTCSISKSNGTVNTTNHTAYTTNTSYNHRMILVGWNDDYPKENISTSFGSPAHNGAFQVLDNGTTYWLSYDSANLQDTIVAYDVAVPYSEEWYTHNYVGGNAGGLGNDFMALGESPTSNGYRNQNVPIGIEYTANGHQTVKAIGFATSGGINSNSSEWRIAIYKGSRSDGVFQEEQTVTFDYKGFYTIPLNNPFTVNNGDKFYIQVTPLTDDNCTIETAQPNGVSAASSRVHFGPSYGKTYVNGQDVTDDYQVIIHAYTTDISETTSSSILSSTNNITAVYGDPDYNLFDYFDFTPGTTENGYPTRITSIVSNNPEVISIETTEDTGSAKSIIGAKAIIHSPNVSPVQITVTTSDGVTTTIQGAVARKNVSTLDISGLRATPYNNLADAVPVVKDGSTTLRENVDYTVTRTANDAYSGTVTIRGIGNYQGERNFTVGKTTASTITAENRTINSANVTHLSLSDIISFTAGMDANGSHTTMARIYVDPTQSCADQINWTSNSGTAWENVVLNIYGGGTISIRAMTSDAIEATATITVTGSARSYRTIDMANVSVEYDRTLTLPSGGYVQSPAITVRYNGRTLTNGVHYEYSRNTIFDPGTYNFTITGIDRNTTMDDYDRTYYVGEKTCSYEVRGNVAPPAPEEPSSPSEETKPEEKKDETKKAINASGNSAKVEITLKKEVPYSKNKKAIASACNVSLTIIEGSGISIKSVKAKKPKKNATTTTVTIKLKGSDKASKKAVKIMNKSLKNIPITLTNGSNDTSTQK